MGARKTDGLLLLLLLLHSLALALDPVDDLDTRGWLYGVGWVEILVQVLLHIPMAVYYICARYAHALMFVFKYKYLFSLGLGWRARLIRDCNNYTCSQYGLKSSEPVGNLFLMFRKSSHTDEVRHEIATKCALLFFCDAPRTFHFNLPRATFLLPCLNLCPARIASRESQ